MMVVYHNPRCSKSRSCIEYLQNKDIDVKIVKYLESSLTFNELTDIIKLLGIKPEELLRKNEELYKSAYRGKSFSDNEWIQIMVEHPILIERPIVIYNDKAVIARPLDKIDELM